MEDLSAFLEEADMLHLYGTSSSPPPYLGVLTGATHKEDSTADYVFLCQIHGC